MATITSTSTPSAPTLSSPGIGSGLDVNSIVTQLMAIEQQPLTALQNKATTLQSQISAYGSIKSSLSALQGTITGMTTLGGMQTLSATVGASGAASATVGAGATAGSYALNITADGSTIFVGGASNDISVHEAATLKKIGQIQLPGDMSTADLRIARIGS